MKKTLLLITMTALFCSCQKEEKECTVFFDSNMGFEVYPQIVKKGDKVIKPILINMPIPNGQTLVGWYKEEGLLNEWNFNADVVTHDITLYAKWNQNEYSVIFDSNGGSSVTQQTVKEGEWVVRPQDPTRSGYVFVAWYRNKELTWEYTFEHFLEDGVRANMTLYARWHAFDTQFNIAGLTIDNYPSVDGSTSTEPLNTLVACKLLDIIYGWGQNGYNSTWGIDPYFKDDYTATKFSEQVKSSQTHQSFVNLIDYKADLTLSARKISPDEKNHADDAGVSLIETPIALDAFIFIVHPNNPIKSLTIEQIQDIYTGKITNWKEVGGRDATINPYVRNANSGSQELMELMVMKDLDIDDFPVSWDVVFTMQGAYDVVQTDVNAICYSVYYYKEQILRTSPTKTIAIEGVSPDTTTISNNSYPLVAEVYAIIRSDLDKLSMAYKLYELLQTQEGKRVISESGYIPN